MKKLILVAALAAAAAWFSYRWFVDRRAVATYKAFAHAWTRGDMAEAVKHGDAAVAEKAINRQNLRGMPSGAIMEAFHGEMYTIESKTSLPSGDLQLEAKQTIFFDPAGMTTGIGGAMWTTIHHSATLHKGVEGWKVAAFDAKFLGMGETRRR